MARAKDKVNRLLNIPRFWAYILAESAWVPSSAIKEVMQICAMVEKKLSPAVGMPIWNNPLACSRRSFAWIPRIRNLKSVLSLIRTNKNAKPTNRDSTVEMATPETPEKGAPKEPYKAI
ncbi:hypothetical protein D1872_256040 [compost metagenome]